MKKALLVTPCLLSALVPQAFARGVSPYLPLNLEPEVERQIERVLLLGDKPVMTRPIAAATVLDALPRACAIDAVLCEQVRKYIGVYTRPSEIVHVGIEAGSSSGADHVIPNRYGQNTSSAWQASAQGYLQLNDYMLVNAGGVAYEDETNPTGSFVSLGFDWAQLDLGFRPHWLSPLQDSSMLLSTESRTMPSATLSNYAPLTRLGLKYEMFLAKMSESPNIVFKNRTTVGNPRLAGLHVSMEPVSGWSLGFNRELQYGGGERGGSSVGDLFDAFFAPAQFDNAGGNLSVDQQFGNQVASITSSFLYPGRTPFAIYTEYGGEDTSRGKNYLLGNSSLSVGIRFPRLFRQFDFTYEVSEWQNTWYSHFLYRDGLTNDGLVIGHWGADQRVFGDDVGARSQMVDIGWQPSFGGVVELRYRTISNESYSPNTYEDGYDVSLRYSRPFRKFTIGAEAYAGRDVFGESFSRVAAFARYTPTSAGFFSGQEDTSDGPETVETHGAEVFVDAGANSNRVKIDISDESGRVTTKSTTAPHFALGARRAVSDHSDLGARVEYDDIDGHSLIGVRAVDYRYRIGSHFAVGGFLGAARYDVDTPAYGIYGGVGLQFRNVLPGWDVGADARYASKVARDHVLSTDPVGGRPDSFYDITSTTLYITKRF